MKKKIIIAIAIFLILAIGVSGALVYNHLQKDNKVKNKVVVKAQLPALNVYYGKDKVGTVDGYAMEMDESILRDVIVPVGPDKQASMTLETNGNKVKSITYEIANIEDGRLIDAGDITDFSEEEGKVKFKYKASSILEARKEYYARVIVKTDVYDSICYYARLMVVEEEFITEQLRFAENFSDQTFDDETASRLALYLETDNSITHDNLGQVTIESTYPMLVWGTIDPEKTTNTDITIKEICIKDSGQAATYTMNYQIKATNGEKITETYNVAETITVWTCAGKLYVLAYDREVNQVWEPTANTVGNSFIDLGIQNQTEIDFVESTDGQYLSFAINGSVYLMDTDGKQIKTLYKYEAKDADDLYKTKARAIGVDDQGNTTYMIYGYSKTEAHIGKSGISVMSYNNEKKESTEVVFIPCKIPAGMLENQIDKLCYIGDGTLYMMVNNTIYYANLNTKEWGTIIENMEEGSYAINQSGNVLAYNTNGKVFDSTTITVVNLTNGEKRQIENGGEEITVCGYTAANLIYGVGKADETTAFFPMYKMIILDENLNEVKTYEQNNVLIKQVEIQEDVINIKRWKKGKDISDDQLLDNTETKESIAKSSYYLDDVKQRELALSFAYNLNAEINLGIASAAENKFNKDNEMVAEFVAVEGKRYYVYGYGKFQGVYLDKREAVKAARDVYGLIVDEKGTRIWTLEENYE